MGNMTWALRRQIFSPGRKSDLSEISANVGVARAARLGGDRLVTMCLICIDFDRGALKLREAKRALGEMRTTLDAQHLKEVERKLADAEQAKSDDD
jgi:hypothetical protein